jgi:hypothetical protein
MKRRFSVLSGRNLGNVEVDAGRVVVFVSPKGNESRSSLSRLPLFWKLHIAGCLLLFFGLFPLRLFLIPYETELLGSLQRHAYYLFWCDITCFLLAIGLRYLYRLEYFYRIGRVSLGIHIVFISAALALIDIGLTFPVFSLVERLKHHASPHLYVAASIWHRFWFFTTWSLLYFLIRASKNAPYLALQLREAASSSNDPGGHHPLVIPWETMARSFATTFAGVTRGLPLTRAHYRRAQRFTVQVCGTEWKQPASGRLEPVHEGAIHLLIQPENDYEAFGLRPLSIPDTPAAFMI